MGRRTAIGAIIHSTWGNLNIRCSNGKYNHLGNAKKNKSYENTLLLMTREQYKTYCLANQDHILSLTRPSLDRVDRTLHYSLDNIQFIELADNIAKDKTVFTDTSGVCFKCKEEKSIIEFVRDSRRRNGYTNICKLCEKVRNFSK